MANPNPNTKGLTPWKPGQSGNPSGRPRVKPISDGYAYIAKEKLPANTRKKLKLGPGATYGDALSLMQFRAALTGNTGAAREIREAIEGKAAIHTEEEQESPQVDLSAIPTRHVPVPPTDIDIGRFYTPQPVQRKFHASEARYPLLEGGRGGGKSTALLWEAISQCLLVPGVNCLLLRRTLTAMEKGGIEDLFKKQVPRSLYRSYHATKHVITFYNGSNLFFGHVKTDADLLQYQGAEFLFIGWEELTQFTYRQWDFLKSSNRCPIKTYWYKGLEYAVRPRMAAATNPNGIGSGWVKALWIAKKPVGEMAAKYDPTEYEAIHSTYEDNFVYRSDANYIASLESIVDPVLRQAWIPGSWDILAGQFFQNWDPARHVKRFQDVIFEAWQPRWISIDWGFEHATVALWWTRVRLKTGFDPEATRSILLVYRQLMLRHTNEELVAEKIVNANRTGDQPDRINAIYLSPDRFAKIDQHHSIADKMGDVFVQYDLPRPDRANNRRVDGWRLCYTLLDTDGVAVLDNCRDLIESIPQLQRDDKNIEDAQANPARGELPPERVILWYSFVSIGVLH